MKLSRDEDALGKQDSGCFVQANDDFVWRLRNPEKFQASAQLLLREVGLVLAVAVNNGKLDGNGEKNGNSLP